MTHDESQESLALYALGALEQSHAEALKSHLRACAVCSAELTDLRDTAAGLAHAARPVIPPIEVTRRILEAARPRARRSRASFFRAIPWPSLQPTREQRRWRPVTVFARLAVAAVVVILGVSQVNLLNRLREALFLLARGREIMEFIASPDVSTIPLAGTELAHDARALLALDRRSGRVVFLAFDLPPPPRGMAYQLWFIDDGISPGGVFSPDAIGATVLHDQWSPAERKPSLFAVSLEPSSGVRSPTGGFVLLSASWRPPPHSVR